MARAGSPRLSQVYAQQPSVKRRSTATFIILSDVVTVGLIFGIQHSAAGSIDRMLLVFPSSLVSIAAGMIIVRMAIFLYMTEVWKNPLAILLSDPRRPKRAFDQLFRDEGPEAHDPAEIESKNQKSSRPSWLIVKNKESIEADTGVYFALLGVGILAQVLLVAATGGIGDSPYIEILVATFVLGQVRSPSPKSVFTLVVVGFVAASLAHLTHLVVVHYIKAKTSMFTFGTLDHAAPLAFVALMTAVVTTSQISNRNAQRRRTAQEIEVLEDSIDGLAAYASYWNRVNGRAIPPPPPPPPVD